MRVALELHLLSELAEGISVDGIGDDERVLNNFESFLVQGEHLVVLRGNTHLGGELGEVLLVSSLVFSLSAELGEDGLSSRVGGGERSIVGDPLSQTSLDDAGVVSSELRRVLEQVDGDGRLVARNVQKVDILGSSGLGSLLDLGQGLGQSRGRDALEALDRDGTSGTEVDKDAGFGLPSQLGGDGAHARSLGCFGQQGLRASLNGSINGRGL